MANISAILRELMQRKGVTAYRIEKDTGSAITQPAITRILKGDRTPRLKTLRIFADYFEVDISYLLGEEPSPFPSASSSDYSNSAGPCPEGFDEGLWIKVPSVITEVDRDLVKDHFGPGAITIDSIENIDTPHARKIWQYLYYVMLVNVTNVND